MSWLLTHGDQVFILFLAPLIGLSFDLFLSRKVVKQVLAVGALLLFPIVTGYLYIIPFVYQVSGLAVLSGLYYFLSLEIAGKAPKVIAATLLSAVAFCCLGIMLFFSEMSGHQYAEKTWKTGRYKVDYVRDQGLAGGPLMRYELSKYAIVPLFIKKVDAAVDQDTTNNCTVKFIEAKMNFNKCDGSLKSVK